jgi:pilus assembly protein Flp/PilA
MMTDTTAVPQANKSTMPRRLLRDQRGAGLVEYAMLAGLVAIAAFGAFRAFGGSVSGAVTNQSTTVSGIPTSE